MDKETKRLLKKCLGNDVYRPYLGFHYVKEGRVYATNGQILTSARFDDMGYYNGLICDDLKEQLGGAEKYPRIDLVIPKKEGYLKYKINMPNFKLGKKSGGVVQCYWVMSTVGSGYWVIGHKPNKFEVCLNLEYLGMFAGKTVNMYIKDKNKIVLITEGDNFTGSDVYSLVMPMRV